MGLKEQQQLRKAGSRSGAPQGRDCPGPRKSALKTRMQATLCRLNRLYLSYSHAITIGEKKRGHASKGEQGRVYGTAWREESEKSNYNLKFLKMKREPKKQTKNFQNQNRNLEERNFQRRDTILQHSTQEVESL